MAFIIKSDEKITNEDIPTIKKWLKTADINQTLQEGNHTILEYAVMGGINELVDLLLKKGANPTIYTGEWLSLIDLAASFGHLDTIKLLMKNQACKNDFNHDNSLIAAAINGFPEVVKYLIEQGKDIESVEDFHDEKGPTLGFTALRAAVQEGETETVELLCEMGANVNAEGDDTPLYCAAAEGYLDIVKILIDYGAYVNKAVEYGTTPLHIACCWEQYDVAKYLLEHGADPTAVDDDGYSCLQMARRHGGNRKLEKLILDAIKYYGKNRISIGKNRYYSCKKNAYKAAKAANNNLEPIHHPNGE